MIQEVRQELPLQGWDTELRCDAEGCRKSIRFFGHVNLWGAMRTARKSGWTTAPDNKGVWKHFCPDHQMEPVS